MVWHGPDHYDHQYGGEHHARRGSFKFSRAFLIAAVLNVTLVIAQVVYGVVATVALLADAGHNFGDVLGLLLAWGAQGAARWQPTHRYTYGFHSASILAALLNSLVLLVATGAIAWDHAPSLRAGVSLRSYRHDWLQPPLW